MRRQKAGTIVARGGLTSAADVVVDPQTWGQLEWMVSGAIGNSDTMTVGRCTINPGEQNPAHYHPNCDEILHLLQGSIEHRLGEEKFPMNAGDTISIPSGTIHNARNIGAEPAIMMISFSTSDRQVVGE